MKSVMLSIKPKWCEMIARGQKTIEVRKSRPKLEVPFKCYIYCTKADQRLIDILKDGDENYGEIYHGKPVFIKTEKGSVCDMYGKRQKVIGEFICNKIDRLAVCGYDNRNTELRRVDDNLAAYDLDCDYLNKCQLSLYDLKNYSNGNGLYGWHISDLVIYDEPRELSEFEMRRPPQSWCYVEEVKYGEWIHGEYVSHCSECGVETRLEDITPYCPNCGARMDEE